MQRHPTFRFQPRRLLAILLWAALPLAGAAATETLYFADDFSGGGERAFYEGTLDARTFSYVDGRYEIDTTRTDAYGQSVLSEDLDTYRAEVRAQLTRSDDPERGGFGLSFNYRARDGGSDFMLLFAYDRGAYTVLRYLDGQSSVLLTPTKTSLFQAGEEVALTVDASGGHFVCYINGAQVAELREDRLVSGGFGIFAAARSVVRFDDFRVYAEGPEATGFSDDFSGERRLYEGTIDDVRRAYDNGRYLIDTTATDLIGLSSFPDPGLDFEFSADVELLAGDALGGYGLYLRDYASGDEGFNQFRFLVWRDWFAVEQSVADLPLALAEWVQHAAVRPGGVNTLKVRALSGELVFFVNGVEVYRHSDENPHTGAFGFFVSGRSKVAFDNVVFAEL